jgi:hypothetical protein
MDWEDLGWAEYVLPLGINPNELKIIAGYVLDMERNDGRMGVGGVGG